MKRPLSLIIIACFYIFGVINTGLREALAHYRRGAINDGHDTLLWVVLTVVVCIGLLRLRWWAWWVSMLYCAAATCLIGVSAWHGNDHPVYLLLTVPPLIVLFSEKVLEAFFPTVEGDNLGSGKITASTSSAASPSLTETKIEDVGIASSPAPPFAVSPQPEATVPMKQSWNRSDIIATIAAILAGMQLLFPPFFNHLLKQLFGIGN